MFTRVLFFLSLFGVTACHAADITDGGVVVIDLGEEQSEKLNAAWAAGADAIQKLVGSIAPAIFFGKDVSIEVEAVGDSALFYKFKIQRGDEIPSVAYCALQPSGAEGTRAVTTEFKRLKLPRDLLRRFFKATTLPRFFRYLSEEYLMIRYAGVRGCQPVSNSSEFAALSDQIAKMLGDDGITVAMSSIDSAPLQVLADGISDKDKGTLFVRDVASCLVWPGADDGARAINLRLRDNRRAGGAVDQCIILTDLTQAENLSRALGIRPYLTDAYGAEQIVRETLAALSGSIPPTVAGGRIEGDAGTGVVMPEELPIATSLVVALPVPQGMSVGAGVGAGAGASQVSGVAEEKAEANARDAGAGSL